MRRPLHRADAWRLRWLVPAALAVVACIALGSVVLAGARPPDQPFLVDSLIPPAWLAGGVWRHPLGTDAQGRDMVLAVLAALRLSLAVAAIGVVGAVVVGMLVGLAAGQAGGLLDSVAMRIADVQMTFPALLVALLADAAFRLGDRTAATAGAAMTGADARRTVLVLGIAIALGRWPPLARLVRAATRREWRRDYVAAARLAGASVAGVLVRHVAANVMGSMLSLAALDVGLAVMDESTLSYLGLGLPPDQPSLGTLIRAGQEVMLAGAWWVVGVPGAAMVLLVATAGGSAERLLGRVTREPR